MRLAIGKRLTALVLPVLLVVVWFLATRQSHSLYFPPVPTVLDRFRHDWLFTRFGSDVLPSLGRLYSGFLLGSATALVLGMAIGMSSLASRAVEPLLGFVRAIPGPVVVIVFLGTIGVGNLSLILQIALISSFPTLINTISATQRREPALTALAKTYELPWWRTVIHIQLPEVMPQALAGMRIGMAIAVVVMVVGEFEGGSDGVGYFTHQSAESFAIPDLWAGMLLLGILGVASNAALRFAERRLLRWHQDMRQTSAQA